ncbi:hypothetical protein RhiJN_03322 [Ceratobasidium sp. AG-Ba]|nr:hypothetical protein RhiJN_03322 [Ceratobasidium sp. AG-Ba]
MRQPSPPKTGPVSRGATEPLEEGEERSPGPKNRKPRGGRVRKREGRERSNWDSFVATEEDRDDYLSGEENRRIAEPHRGRSRSRTPPAGTRSQSRKSRSRSPGNPPVPPTDSVSREKRSRRHSPRSHSPSPLRSVRSHSPTRSQNHTPRSHARSRTRSRSRTSSPRPSRSRSRSPYRRSQHERESWTERDRKNSPPPPNPGATSATVVAPDPTPNIPTGPRWRASGNQPPAVPVAPRNATSVVRGGPPPTGPRGDREPPRGPRNMMISGANTGPSPASTNTGPGWERPQSSFQSYLAAVQNKLVERESKKKGDDDTGPNSADTSAVHADSSAMDLDVKEEPSNSATGSHLNTPAPERAQSGHINSPVHSEGAQAQQRSVHASPASGPGIPLPAHSGSSHPNVQNPGSQLHSAPQAHPLPLPPRPRSPPRAPRSPPRGPRATRGLPEKPKAMTTGGQDFGRERDRDRDSVERGTRDRNGGSTGGAQVSESERKVHALPTNPARRPRVPVIRTTKREVLFPDLEKEIAALEEQRVRLANEHLPHEIALRQSVHELTLSDLDWQAAEERRIMTEAVLDAMVKGTGPTTAMDL